jgi:hypothetical protein
MNDRELIDEWEVRDLEDNSVLRAQVFRCSSLGNLGREGLQIVVLGRFVNFEPRVVEQWIYKANKQGVQEYLLEEHSWIKHSDQWIKLYLLVSESLKAKVEIKTRSSAPVSKEYLLPFSG